MELLLGELQKHHERYKATAQEINDLIAREQKLLEELLETYKPIYNWYHDQGLVFTHPTLQLRSGTGPILGFDEEKQEVIVFNIEENHPEKVYLHNNKQRKYYSLYQLVTDGYFQSAKRGLKYLEIMMEKYVERNSTTIKKLRSELDED